MADNSRAAAPWQRLPDELMIQILGNLLLFKRSQDLTSRRVISPFLLASKRMSELALEVWGKNNMHLWMHPTATKMPRTPAYVGRHIRRLHLYLYLPASFEWDDLECSHEHSPGERFSWRVLLSCVHHHTSPDSAWQLTFSNLSELKITICLSGGPRSRYCFGDGAGSDMEQFLASASCNLHAAQCTVNIIGFECGSSCQQRCTELLAKGIKLLIEGKRPQRGYCVRQRSGYKCECS